jgi:hypothetical protein
MSEVITDAAGTADNAFKLVFAPAKLTLDTARRMKPLLRSVEKGFSKLNEKDAGKYRDEAIERYNAIPDMLVLSEAGLLFEEAEFRPASEEWLHAAIGVIMLDAMPNAKNVSPIYRESLVDAILFDEEAWGGRYRTGFSVAVVTEAIREVRRTCEFVPSQATFLKFCAQHRAQFENWQLCITRLEEMKENAEDILFATGDLEEPDWEKHLEKRPDCKLALTNWLSGRQSAPLLAAPNHEPRPGS